MNIAYFSPLPNQRTGIANYSNHLVSELSRFAQVELFHDGAQYFPGLKVNNYLAQPSSLGRLHEFDSVVFNFGNNPEFHLAMWHVFQMNPGVVILHDAVLYYLMAGRGKGGIIRENLGKKPTTIDRLRRTLEIVEKTDRPGWLLGHSQPHKFPCLESIISKAKGIIVHSHSASELVRKAGFAGSVDIIPMPVYNKELEAVSHCIGKRAETRRRLGLKKNDILLGCFGFQNRVKRNTVLVKAAERLNNKSNLKLLFAGIGELPVEQINNSPIASDIICPGYLSDKEFREYLAASDIVVNLRYPSMGETSATLLLAMLHSKPCIVTADSWFAELPDDCVLKINHDRRELIELVNAIEQLIAIPSKRREFGDNARNYVKKYHHPNIAGIAYQKVLERSNGEFNKQRSSNFTNIPKFSLLSNYFINRTEDLISFGGTRKYLGSKNSGNEPKNRLGQTSASKKEINGSFYKTTWNKLAENFESAKFHVTGDANEKELKNSSNETISRINRYVNFTTGDIVLEIGCGIGRVGKELAPRCKKWIGCDISGNMLAHARKRLSHLENIELVELPESNLSPIRDSSIDVVYCTVVFMHLDEWDRYEYIKEAFRVLKSGGRAYFDNFSLTTEEGWRIFKAHHEMSERPSHISKSSTREELHEYMIRSKFEDIQTELDDLWVIVSGFKNKEVGTKTTKFVHTKKSSTKILSLHFPKTGGTSFGKILQMIYGESYMPHYPQLEEQGDEKSEIFENKSCVHGHLVLDRYVQLYEPGLFITWLRCPINRTISLYNHILKSPDATNSLHQKVITDKLSLIEFVELEMNWNQLFHWIGNRNPEDFKVIGFLETAQASIVKCAAALNWTYIPEFPWVNKTKNGNIIKVSPNEREFIRSKNKDELLWIEKAKEIFG